MGRRTVMTDEIAAKAVAMNAEGMGCYAIGDALGVDATTIRKHFLRHGVQMKPVPAKWDEWEDDLLARMLKKGATYATISAALDKLGRTRTENACQNRASKIGLGNMRPKREPNPPVNKDNGGWPRMCGDDETRDAQFVEMVCAAGGTPVVILGRGWVWPVLEEQRRAA